MRGSSGSTCAEPWASSSSFQASVSAAGGRVQEACSRTVKGRRGPHAQPWAGAPGKETQQGLRLRFPTIN